MSDDLSHLKPAAADLLQAPQDQRIGAILSESWVQYTRAGQVLRILDLLLQHPRTTRMPSIAIYGNSGMGKTMIMQRFRAQHPPVFDGLAGVERTRVLALQLAGKPNERRLYTQILSALGVPQNPRAAVVELEQVAIRLMRAMDVQVLLLDEVHNILAGTFREQRIVLNTMRYISNELQVSLVCFGVNEAREAISGDVQLARRFEEFPLTRWSAETSSRTWCWRSCEICRCATRRYCRRGRCGVCCRLPTASPRRSSACSASSPLKRSRAARSG